MFLLISSFSYSQKDGERLYDHELDEEKWERLRDGIRYEGREGAGRRWTYESDEEWRKAQKNSGGKNGSGSGGGQGNGQGSGYGSGDGAPQQYPEYQPPPESPSVNSPSMNLGWLGYVLMGLLVIALMILIYYMFINSNSKGKKISRDEIMLEDTNPTEIPLTELQRMLQEALARGDYRAAVRIYFIFIIKDLAEKKWIQWEKEKTNFHYLREMSGKDEYTDFNRSVSFFEYIWYGEREIDQSTFEQIKPNFTLFLEKLGVE